MTTRFLTTKEAMKFLKLKRLSTLYRYIHSGKLKAYRLGDGHGPWRIDEEDLERFIKREASNEGGQ